MNDIRARIASAIDEQESEVRRLDLLARVALPQARQRLLDLKQLLNKLTPPVEEVLTTLHSEGIV